MPTMGFNQPEWGDINSVTFKRKFRWKFMIPDVSASGVNSLPPLKSARPSLSFKEMVGEHLNETIYYPQKPDWKNITLTLYDLCRTVENPVFSWIKRAYNPKNCSGWFPSIDSPSLKALAVLQLYDGCGSLIEEWLFEHAWPQTAEFGDLDMGESSYVTVDVTLRYDRAYITVPTSAATLGFSTVTVDCGTPVCPAIPSVVCPSPSVTPLAARQPMVDYKEVKEPDFKMLW